MIPNPVVKCFDRKMADYNAGGLGAVEVTVVSKEEPKVGEPVVIEK